MVIDNGVFVDMIFILTSDRLNEYQTNFQERYRFTVFNGCGDDLRRRDQGKDEEIKDKGKTKMLNKHLSCVYLMFGAEGLLNEEVIPLELHLGVYVRVLHVTTSSKECIQPRNGGDAGKQENGQTCESLALSFFIQRPLQ